MLAFCCFGAYRWVVRQCQGVKRSAFTSAGLQKVKGLSKQFEVHRIIRRTITHKQKTFQDGSQSSQEQMSQQIHPKVRQCNGQRNCRKPKSSSSDSAKKKQFKVHDGTIRKRLVKCGLFGCVAGGNFFFLSLLKRSWQHDLDCKIVSE